MELDSLFDVDEFSTVPSLDPLDEPSGFTKGIVAEQWATAILLERGFRVARPVMDDDGVDLIVNYRTTVQVKCTDRLAHSGGAGNDRLQFTLANCANRVHTDNRMPHHGYRNVDFFVLCWFSMRRWWIVPRDVVLSNRHINLALDGKYRFYENAWDLLGGDLRGQEVR